MTPLAIVAIALTAASALFVLLLLGRRLRLTRLERRRRELVERLRPHAIALVEGDEMTPGLQGREEELFAELLGSYARVLRGPARERIAAYFEASGAVDRALRRLRSPVSWRRATAAFGLGDMCSERAVPALLGALDDKRRDVRSAAARSLGRLRSVDAIEALVAVEVERRVPRAVTNAALLEIGPAALARLMPLTTHSEAGVRADAVELVGLLGDADDSRSLQERLRDPSAPVRAAAAGALGRLGAAQARDGLIVALGDGVPLVRAGAARALGEIGGRQAAEALLPLARGDAFEPAEAAAQALIRIDPALVARVAESPGAGSHLREAADLAAL